MKIIATNRMILAVFSLRSSLLIYHSIIGFQGFRSGIVACAETTNSSKSAEAQAIAKCSGRPMQAIYFSLWMYLMERAAIFMCS
jgi:hypothetical protein